MINVFQHSTHPMHQKCLDINDGSSTEEELTIGMSLDCNLHQNSILY
jgi:hypothetical protein